MIHFRFTISSIVCVWRHDTIAAFLVDCDAFASNNVDFSVEFSEEGPKS